MTHPNTPVIIGVGQFVERLDQPDYKGLSQMDIAAAAARAAIADVGNIIAARIDAVATTRSFDDTTFDPNSIGSSNNFPRSVANRLGLNPVTAYWENAGGDSPQRLLYNFGSRIARGEIRVALLAGAEAISTARNLRAQRKKCDWHEQVEGNVEDQGPGLKGLISYYEMQHRLYQAPGSYGLLENARRGRLKRSREAYLLEMGQLFAPMSEVARSNPFSSAVQPPYSVEDLVCVSERNRMIADPYPQRLVARDQVNQGAAVLIATLGLARELGIAAEKRVYLHGYGMATERPLIERAELSEGPASRLAARAALAAAGVSVEAISFFDFYSCFPIAVANVACDLFGLRPDDPRGLTVTGGLPFFGGPGNNYAMHAIAQMVERLRAAPGAYGFVGANGGVLSKYAAGVYSTRPAAWPVFDPAPIEAEVAAWPAPAVAHEADGWARIETYTIGYAKGEPAYAVVVGMLEANGARFLANNEDGDTETLAAMLAEDPLGRRILVRSEAKGNRFAFLQERMDILFPKRKPAFRLGYEFLLVERRAHVLEVTINRPELRNCLHPMANAEMAEVFDAYLADPDLWCAILTGAGPDAFCAGADLRYAASGQPFWCPKSGFGGLTRRRGRNKPIIAAWNGLAMGGGLEISLACDMIAADEKAQFALSEVRVGVVAGMGGTVRLPRHIPRKLAMELLLTGRRAGVQEGVKFGLINRVAPHGKVMETARALAAEIVEASPTSVRLTLQAVAEGDAFASDVDAADAAIYSPLVNELITSEDRQEGLMAFGQKRKPIWKNR